MGGFLLLVLVSGAILAFPFVAWYLINKFIDKR